MADSVSEFALTASPSVATEATHALGEALTGAGSSVLDRAVLLISELITNERGVRTFVEGDVLSLKVISADGSARIEIRDAGTGVLLGGLRTHHRSTSQGWSPHLLSQIADRWGLVSGADGAWVWFELDGPRHPA
jgi:uncharacterized protein YhdP